MQFTPQSLNNLPESSGVYLFKDKNGSILYIGKAKNLKKRVSSYFRNKIDFNPKIASLIKHIETISIIEVESEFEALLLEAKLIRKLRPKYNIVWKDDKHYIYIKITTEKFPRIIFGRKEDDTRAIFFGPFPSSHIVKDILSFLRQIFPYCNQKRTIKRPCFYTHIGLCDPCPAEIEKFKDEEYRRKKLEYLNNIRQIKLLLSGRLPKVRNYLNARMKHYSDKNEFENAASYRNKLQHLDYLIHNYHPAEVYIENPYLIKDIRKEGLEQLQKILVPYFPDLCKTIRIECYDISTIFGKHSAGSMVTFIGGKPEKKYYRHFRIKFKNTPDDFAMLSEVMKRRLSHPEWGLPDLLVIDGGKPQLAVLLKVLKNYGKIIPIIGLAKEYEKLVIPENGSFVRLKLPRNSSSLHLIQRLRDEAHRFAKRYHEMLRLKSLLPR